MKKLIVAIAVGMVALGAMAQGRVAFANNTQRLVYWAADNAAVSVADATAKHLVADLYVGSAADSLAKAASVNSWVGAGQWTSLTTALPTGFAGGSTTKWFFQVRVSGDNGVFGQSEVFQAFAASSPISANNLTVTGTPTFSTWLPGTQALTGGGFGAISVVAVPEPASFALAGLGAAALLIFRRRN